VINFLSENGHDKLMEEFFHYINQTDGFYTEMKCWTKVNNPWLFWQMQVSSNLLISINIDYYRTETLLILWLLCSDCFIPQPIALPLNELFQS
jgi:hypothetical protein